VVDVKARRSLIVFIVAVLMLAAAIIYFDTELLGHVKQTSQQQGSAGDETENGFEDMTDPDTSMEEDAGEPGDDTGTGSSETGEDEEDRPIFSESVTVSYNTPEYDLAMMLCEDKDNRAFLRLKYYMDGASVENELDQEQIPELAGIFESRGDAGQGDKQQAGSAEQSSVPEGDRPYSIGQALLNPVRGQLYIMVNGAKLDQYIQSSFYMVDLNDMSVKKLFSYPAKYGKMYFSRDFSKLAYSFLDPPKTNMYPEDSVVEVFDCINSEFLIRGSRKADDSVIGKNSAPGYIYDYTFEGWQSPGVIKLAQIARPSGNNGAEPVRSEVLYDIEADLLLNLDGTEISPAGSGGGDGMGEENGPADNSGTGTAEGNQPDRNEPVEQLKLFYRYLGSDADYSRAMLMLADDFVLRMGLLTQFGVNEIYKSDIDANQESAAVYADLLRAARFGSLVGVSMPDEDTAEISYIHTIGLTEDSQFSQEMKATMKKQGANWVITLIEDGSK